MINDFDQSILTLTSHQNLLDGYQDGPLTFEQYKAFHQDGYFIIKNFYSDDEVDQVKQATHQLQIKAQQLFEDYDDYSKPILHDGSSFVLGKDNDTHQIKRVVWAGAAQPELLQLGRIPKLLGIVAQLLGSHSADHLINQVHFKLPGDAVSFPWHQDCQHRRRLDNNWKDVNGLGSFVQSLLAVDAANVANGTLEIIPNTVVKGDLHLDQIIDEDELEQRVGSNRIPLIVESGDMIFMHPCLVHGSRPNNSDHSRRMFINGFSYPGANHKPYPGQGSAERISLVS